MKFWRASGGRSGCIWFLGGSIRVFVELVVVEKLVSIMEFLGVGES